MRGTTFVRRRVKTVKKKMSKTQTKITRAFAKRRTVLTYYVANRNILVGNFAFTVGRTYVASRKRRSYFSFIF